MSGMIIGPRGKPRAVSHEAEAAPHRDPARSPSPRVQSEAETETTEPGFNHNKHTPTYISVGPQKIRRNLVCNKGAPMRCIPIPPCPSWFSIPIPSKFLSFINFASYQPLAESRSQAIRQLPHHRASTVRANDPSIPPIITGPN